MTQETSLKSWLIGQIKSALPAKGGAGRFMIWCDPDREWIELLRIAAEAAGVELWAPAPGEPDPHELALRDRFHREPRRRRIVWLPRTRAEITYFKVYELEADVWIRGLAEALSDYGVPVARRHEAELRPILHLQARNLFDQPRSAWGDLTPSAAKGALFDDGRILDVLTSDRDVFPDLRAEGVFAVFAGRVMEDLGLPDPDKTPEPDWRIESMRRLLLMEAANSGGTPPLGARELPAGRVREYALKLLQRCMHDIRLVAGFERAVHEAERHLGLDTWARSQSSPPRTTASRAVEEALLRHQIDRFESIDDVFLLARELAAGFSDIAGRAQGFWGSRAAHPVAWRQLKELADAACTLTHFRDSEHSWATARDMILAYAHDLWRLERAGELLFREVPGIADPLHRIRARLRKAYQRTIDDLGRQFSQRLDAAGPDLDIPSAGERVLKELGGKKQPTALVILDAFRFELARRLAEQLQLHDPPERLEVDPALAPIPSITALGMPFALPIPRNALTVSFTTGKRPQWSVTAEGWTEDLTVAENRRRWLVKKGGAKACLTTHEVLEGARLRELGDAQKLIMVYGDEFDRDGHEGALELSGAEDHLKRYTQVLRALRAAGYTRVIVTTDHGFFHWKPDDDEREDLPQGDIVYQSRRAVAGRGLSHATGLRLPVPRSDLEVVVPRSVNVFRTYGAVGFLHGGATLQELVIPVVVAVWPAKRKKTPVSLHKIEPITTLQPRIEVVSGLQGEIFAGGAYLPRRVLVRVSSPAGLLFQHHDPVTVDPQGKPTVVTLKLVDPKPDVPVNTALRIEVRDADNDEFLLGQDTILKVEINSDWD